MRGTRKEGDASANRKNDTQMSTKRDKDVDAMLENQYNGTSADKTTTQTRE